MRYTIEYTMFDHYRMEVEATSKDSALAHFHNGDYGFAGKHTGGGLEDSITVKESE